LNNNEVIDLKMHKHYKILGYLFIVSGLIGLLDYLYLWFGSGYGFEFIDISGYIPLAIITSKLIAGFGLIKLKTWSRIFGIIISVISLIGFPIGTAIGIYGLWVLTRKKSKVIQSSSSVNVMEGKKTSTGRNTLKDIKDGKGEDLYESENYQEAFKYFIEVAQQGYPNAQNYLGYMYLNGQGVDQDNSKALEWYEKAATLGHAPSQYSLGYMYHQGVGVATDLVRATFWYQKAADQGNEEAKEILKEIQ
jgi:hypothetical protein